MNNFYQLKIVARNVVKKNLKTFSYWNVVGLPLVTLITFLKIYKKVNSLNAEMVALITAVFVPLAIFFIGIFYVNIIVNEIANDKSTRMMEILLSISSAESQLYGKFVGTIILLLIQMGLYVVAFATVYISNISSLFSEFINDVPKQLLFFLPVDILLGVFVCLIWSSEIASFISDKGQVSAAIVPIMVLLITGLLVAEMFASLGPIRLGSSDIIARILIDLGMCFPPVGIMLSPTLLVNGTLGIIEVLVDTIVQILISLWMFKHTLKQYKKGVVSYSKKNPFLKALAASSK